MIPSFLNLEISQENVCGNSMTNVCLFYLYLHWLIVSLHYHKVTIFCNYRWWFA